MQWRGRIARAAPTLWILKENAAVDQRKSIAMGGIRRAIRELRVF
jgi:hypothetical protein